MSTETSTITEASTNTAGRLRTAVIVGSTRPGRKARAVAEWVAADTTCPALDLQVVDLADVDLPMLAEPAPAISGAYAHERTRDWSQLVAGFDAFVLVTPEYNHSTTAVLKNALDHLYAEWQDKAVAFVGYGVEGGTRAVEHLRGITAELGLAGVGAQVSLSLADVVDGACTPGEEQARARGRMLTGLARWAAALHPLRAPSPSPAGDGKPEAAGREAERPALLDDAAQPGAEAAVERFVAELQASLDAGDADRYDRPFAADVLWGTPYGRTLAGFGDLNCAHRSLMSRSTAPPSRYEVVRALAHAPEIVLAHVRRQALTHDGTDAPDGFSEMALYALVQRDGQWWLAAGQNTPVAEPPSRPPDAAVDESSHDADPR